MWKHRWLTNMRFCKAHLARQVPEEILTEIVFLDIIYTALNILCKSSDTNQSSILNINSYTLSYTQILANELINTYSLAATSSLHQALWDCIFFCWNWSSFDQKEKKGSSAEVATSCCHKMNTAASLCSQKKSTRFWQFASFHPLTPSLSATISPRLQSNSYCSTFIRTLG